MSEYTTLDTSTAETMVSTIDELVDNVLEFHPKADVDLLRRAYTFSEKAHEGQIRRSGEPYISHPLGVAAILTELHLDLPCIITGLLHDTVEDTDVSLEDIRENFGDVIAHLVDGVTKISKMTFRQTHEKQGENIRKMIVAMGKDVRVVLVKLADRLHNMRTLNHMSYAKQARIAQETLDIYAPLASRLGISSLKIELEDLSFRYSNSESYYDLVQKVNKKKKEREKYIEDVKKNLHDEIKSRTKFDFEVQGRPKHFYSIYKKMQMRNVEYDQVYDLLAFRVCVNTISECYEVLGIVHSIWRPIPGRFKDFIAMPKTNNYQSLHTTVIGPSSERIEVQIRTHDMNRVAEWGIAAHWKYKETSRGQGGDTTPTDIDRFHWLRELVSMHQQTNDSDEFLENIKSDLLESEIYVFTPKGDVKEFPDGATPIDFAYSIHTDVGSSIVAARVDGKLVSLRHQLKNGDTIEVITSKNQTPSKDWLKYCVTTRAKSKIRAHVKAEQRARALAIGKELVDKGFRKLGLGYQKYLDGDKFNEYCKDNGCNNVDDFLIQVGYGKLTVKHAIEALVEDLNKDKEEEDDGFLTRAIKSAVGKKKKSSSLVNVDGMSDVLVRYAKCCNPIPGDPIVGFISLGRGIVIHTADCEKTFELDQDRKLDVAWSGKRLDQAERMVKIRVVCQDIQGLLKNMTEVISQHGVNIHNVQARTMRDGKAICTFDVGVKDTAQLHEMVHALQKLKGVIVATRAAST